MEWADAIKGYHSDSIGTQIFLLTFGLIVSKVVIQATILRQIKST
jgi:hypothetical protein